MLDNTPPAPKPDIEIFKCSIPKAGHETPEDLMAKIAATSADALMRGLMERKATGGTTTALFGPFALKLTIEIAEIEISAGKPE